MGARFKSNRNLKLKLITAALSMAGSLVLVTPLCGIVFQCHCDWPWSGFYDHCNFFVPDSMHKCPWCFSKLTGMLSIGMALIDVFEFSVRRPIHPFKNIYANVVICCLCGLGVFILVASAGALAAAYAQNYPFGIMSHFRD